MPSDEHAEGDGVIRNAEGRQSVQNKDAEQSPSDFATGKAKSTQVTTTQVKSDFASWPIPLVTSKQVRDSTRLRLDSDSTPTRRDPTRLDSTRLD